MICNPTTITTNTVICAKICIKTNDEQWDATHYLLNDALKANEYDGALYKWSIYSSYGLIHEIGEGYYNDNIGFNLGTYGNLNVGSNFLDIKLLLTQLNIFIIDNTFSLILSINYKNNIKNNKTYSFNG